MGHNQLRQAMTAADPLEALRAMEARWLACKDHQFLAAAIAAWEKERDVSNQLAAEMDAGWMRRIDALRAEVLTVAERLYSWCEGKSTHHEWCGCQIAARLRKACE